MADVQLELPDGRTVRKRKAGFKTEKEALDFERQLRGELLGGTYERLRRLERWARPATGVVFVLAGLYETLRGTFRVI